MSIWRRIAVQCGAHLSSCAWISHRQAPIKRTNVEKQVNSRIIILFALLVLLSLVSTVGGVIRTVSVVADESGKCHAEAFHERVHMQWFFDDKAWYLSGSQQGNKGEPESFVQRNHRFY